MRKWPFVALATTMFLAGCIDPTPLFDRKVKVGGVDFTFKAGYPIYYYRERRVERGVLSGEHEVEGTNWSATLKDLTEVRFHIEQDFRSMSLSAEHNITINRQSYAVEGDLKFHPQNLVESLVLSKSQAIRVDGEVFVVGEGTVVRFSKNGDFLSATSPGGEPAINR